MIVRGDIRKGAYFDSVTLMTVGKEVSAMDGVIDAAVVMGTKENKAIIETSGLLTPEFEAAGDTDLLIGIKAESDAVVQQALAAVEELLKKARNRSDDSGASNPLSLESAVKRLPDANLVLISVAGRYAGAEAMKALESGLHVMLFSDNVSIEEEVALKTFARERGLLVMGPDCGTAIINGVPLAFANVVNRGRIGIVAASGTGLQEVSCIISNEGAGISQAIGTGGRDVKKEVGGIMFLESLKALAEDEQTDVIVLVSKPPHKEVLEKVTKLVNSISTPVVSIFLGAGEEGEGKAATLEEAALTAVAFAAGEGVEAVKERLSIRDKGIAKLAGVRAAECRKGQRYIRGLFSGGTFCTEAQILLKGMVSDIYANSPANGIGQLEDSLKSRANTVVDLGEDEFTVGRPHPMIDFSLRNKRIDEESNDPETAVILLDVVLGYGSNMDPVGELQDVVREAAAKVCVVCAVIGTDQDPQNRSRVQEALRSCGAIVMESNAAACKLAGYIINGMEPGVGVRS
ncbi:MAG: acyl-CoA synthetase FdrA [Verrucomicrobia bacterium]|nr:acyl-CoA synthetase FdrA [Verrucomicrobiota bacterium]